MHRTLDSKTIEKIDKRVIEKQNEAVRLHIGPTARSILDYGNDTLGENWGCNLGIWSKSSRHFSGSSFEIDIDKDKKMTIRHNSVLVYAERKCLDDDRGTDEAADDILEFHGFDGKWIDALEKLVNDINAEFEPKEAEALIKAFDVRL